MKRETRRGVELRLDGDLVRRWREAVGWSQEIFAERTEASGFDQSLRREEISEVEGGFRRGKRNGERVETWISQAKAETIFEVLFDQTIRNEGAAIFARDHSIQSLADLLMKPVPHARARPTIAGLPTSPLAEHSSRDGEQRERLHDYLVGDFVRQLDPFWERIVSARSEDASAERETLAMALHKISTAISGISLHFALRADDPDAKKQLVEEWRLIVERVNMLNPVILSGVHTGSIVVVLTMEEIDAISLIASFGAGRLDDSRLYRIDLPSLTNNLDQAIRDAKLEGADFRAVKDKKTGLISLVNPRAVPQEPGRINDERTFERAGSELAFSSPSPGPLAIKIDPGDRSIKGTPRRKPKRLPQWLLPGAAIALVASILCIVGYLSSNQGEKKKIIAQDTPTKQQPKNLPEHQPHDPAPPLVVKNDMRPEVERRAAFQKSLKELEEIANAEANSEKFRAAYDRLTNEFPNWKAEVDGNRTVASTRTSAPKEAIVTNPPGDHPPPLHTTVPTAGSSPKELIRALEDRAKGLADADKDSQEVSELKADIAALRLREDTLQLVEKNPALTAFLRAKKTVDPISEAHVLDKPASVILAMQPAPDRRRPYLFCVLPDSIRGEAMNVYDRTRALASRSERSLTPNLRDLLARGRRPIKDDTVGMIIPLDRHPTASQWKDVLEIGGRGVDVAVVISPNLDEINRADITAYRNLIKKAHERHIMVFGKVSFSGRKVTAENQVDIYHKRYNGDLLDGLFFTDFVSRADGGFMSANPVPLYQHVRKIRPNWKIISGPGGPYDGFWLADVKPDIRCSLESGVPKTDGWEGKDPARRFALIVDNVVDRGLVPDILEKAAGNHYGWIYVAANDFESSPPPYLAEEQAEIARINQRILFGDGEVRDNRNPSMKKDDIRKNP